MAVDTSKASKPDAGLIAYHTLSGDGSTTPVNLKPGFTTVSIVVPGSGATCQLQVSYDGGQTWYGVAPTSLTICDDTSGNMSFQVYEEEQFVLYRMTVSDHAGGTASIRYSGSAPQ